MAIEQAILEQIGEFLRGTCKSVQDAINSLELGDDIDESQLEGDLLNADTEMCGQCNWWHEVCELTYNNEHGCGLCDDCRDELGIADE